MMTQRILLTIAITLCLQAPAYTQAGYYLTGIRVLPDVQEPANFVSIPVTPNREDVKSIGQGRTQIANGLVFNAMLSNPALLAEERTTFDLPSVVANIPENSITAAMFLKDHSEEFSKGSFLHDIMNGVSNFQSATTSAQRLVALNQVQQGMRFPADLQDNVGASVSDPHMHGVHVTPAFQIQAGHVGVSMYASGQLGFIVRTSPAVEKLAAYPLPATVGSFTPKVMMDLVRMVGPLFDLNGDPNPAGLPSVYAVSYVDAVGVIGYGTEVSPGLSVGVNLKVVNRRFSAKWVDASNFDNIVDEVRQDMEASATGTTVDLGGLYTLPSTGTRLGLTIQNLLPLRALQSVAEMRRLETSVDYARDNSGNIVVVNGDTGLVSTQQTFYQNVTYEISDPVEVSVGCTQRLLDMWDVSFDWVDVAAQDGRYGEYLSRFRLGTEFRLDVLDRLVGVAVRGGVADRHPTYGLGLNLFKVLQVDGAYAYDPFTDENSYFAQLKVGW